MNDETHLGFFDVPMITDIPGIKFLAPTNAEEYLSMLDWAIDQRERPVVVRTPSGDVLHVEGPVQTDWSDTRYEIVEQGEGNRVAIIAAGDFLPLGREAAGLMRDKGIKPTVINPRILSELDTATLYSLKDYELVITIEDNSLDGGMGQKIAAYLGEAPVKVRCLGLPKTFPDRFNAAELLESRGLTPEKIAALAE